MQENYTSNPKQEILKRQGALNPRPQDVSDPLFLANDFFDPCDLVQVKYEMLRRVREEGQSVSCAAESFGFSRVSFYKAQAAFEEYGLAGLVPSRRGPRGAHKLSEIVMDFLLQSLDEDKSLRSSTLAKRVRECFGFSLHPRTIEKALTQRQKKPRTRK